MSARILQLRQQLRDSFPKAHAYQPEQPLESAISGLRCLDEVGGVPRGRLTEVVAPQGSGAFLGMVLRALATEGKRAALIDGRNALDPQSLGPELCRNVLWVRCCEATEAIKAADLLLRDGNLPVVILDLQMNTQRDLAEIPNPTWYRLRNLAEETDTALLTLTETRRVPCAALRLELRSDLTMESLETPRRDVEARLRVAVLRSLRKTLATLEENRMVG